MIGTTQFAQAFSTVSLLQQPTSGAPASNPTPLAASGPLFPAASLSNRGAEQGIIIVGGKGPAVDPGANRGIIIIGGRHVVPNSGERGIIIIGG